jgi:hypothetical protein
MSEVDIVLKIGSRVDGAPTPVDGQFIVRYDPTFDRTGAYRLDTSAEIEAAIGFSTVLEAAQYIRRRSPNKRYDSPGHINRPITCYHIELLPRVKP